MALSLAPIVALTAVLYYLYSYIASLIAERKFQKFAKENGCSAPYKAVNRLPWGVERLYRMMRAPYSGEDLFEDIIVPRNIEAGFTDEGSGLFGSKMIQTADPKNIQAVLATKFKDFEQGERRHKQFAVLGKGIFNVDGPDWERARALMRPQFSREQINDLVDTEHSTQLLFQAMPVGADGWVDMDIGPLFYRFTLDNATAFLFGNSLDSLKDVIPGAGGELSLNDAELMAQRVTDSKLGFSEAVATVQHYMGTRIRMQGLYWLVDSAKFRQATAYVRGFINYYVEMALRASADHAEKKYGTSKKYNLLAALVNESRDGLELRDNALSILFAGRDSTAALLSWVFLEVAQRPDIQRKLRQTVEDDFGNDPENINFTTLKSCRYLQYLLNETLRMWPIVPVNNRRAVRDTVIPSGGGPNHDQPIAVRKGQLVNWITYSIHRRKDIWGEDALEFKPERWEGRKTDWSFVPFGGGPRICLGQQYALTEAGYLIVRILQTFDKIEWRGPTGKPRKGLGLVLYPRDGVHVRMRLREKV